MSPSDLALPHVAKLHAYTPGLQPAESGWVKLNTNECPYPPSPRVAEAVRRDWPGMIVTAVTFGLFASSLYIVIANHYSAFTLAVTQAQIQVKQVELQLLIERNWTDIGSVREDLEAISKRLDSIAKGQK